VALLDMGDWASFEVSKSAMLLGSIVVMFIRIAAPIMLVHYQTRHSSTGQLRLLPPLPNEMNQDNIQ